MNLRKTLCVRRCALVRLLPSGKVVESGGVNCDSDTYGGSCWSAGRIFRCEAAVTKGSATNGGSARRYAVLSIAAAATTIGLKLGAYDLTGSVGLSPTRPSLWSTSSPRLRRCGR